MARGRSRGKVLWHLTMSLDGFIAGPNHSMDWLGGLAWTPGIVDEYVGTTGAILAGRRGYDLGYDEHGTGAHQQAYGGKWKGPIFVLTHRPEEVPDDPNVTFLSCDVAEAVAIALDAAQGKNLEIFGADIARQCLQRGGLIDEFHVHLAPVMLGDGVRLVDCPGLEPVHWQRLDTPDPDRAIDLRYRPA